jgi:hypothetical protein
MSEKLKPHEAVKKLWYYFEELLLIGRGGASHMARYGACHTLIFLELIPQNHTSCHEHFKELKNC